MIESKAIKSKNAKVIANFLIKRIFLRYGIPQIKNSDWENEFNIKLLKQLCYIMKTKKTFYFIYNPKSNECVERCNKTIIYKFAKLCLNNWKRWDEYLPFATFAYNISLNTKNKLSPFEIIYGRTADLYNENILLNDEE